MSAPDKIARSSSLSRGGVKGVTEFKVTMMHVLGGWERRTVGPT